MSNPYYTHREFLIAELDLLTNKPSVRILEFGVGDGSSLIFNQFAKNNSNFNIESFETDKNWLESMKDKYQLPNYRFNYIENWNDFLISDNFSGRYDLIFVDQAPWEARIKTIDTLIPFSKTIILHDYDFFNHGLINDIYDVGIGSYFDNYSKRFNMIGHHNELPPTLIFHSI